MGLSWIADDTARPASRRLLTGQGRAPGRDDAAGRHALARPRRLAAAAAWLSEAAGAHVTAGYLPGGPARRSFRRYWV